jgi:hypothetical protein
VIVCRRHITLYSTYVAPFNQQVGAPDTDKSFHLAGHFGIVAQTARWAIDGPN